MGTFHLSISAQNLWKEKPFDGVREILLDLEFEVEHR